MHKRKQKEIKFRQFIIEFAHSMENFYYRVEIKRNQWNIPKQISIVGGEMKKKN